jgi:hypothetical protein
MPGQESMTGKLNTSADLPTLLFPLVNRDLFMAEWPLANDLEAHLHNFDLWISHGSFPRYGTFFSPTLASLCLAIRQ